MIEATAVGTRSDWLADRRTGIGGSDLAAILGLSDWKSELDVYLEKVGETTMTPPGKRMRRGLALEPLILKRFSSVMGLEDVERQQASRIGKHEFMRATVDGLIPSRPGCIVEAKCAWSPNGWGEDRSGDVPPYYLTQCWHYLAVMESQTVFMPVLFGQDGVDWEPNGDGWAPTIADDADFRIYVVERDDEGIEKIIDAERDFWFNHVVPRVPPQPTTRKDAAKLWARDNGQAIEAAPDVIDAVNRLKVLRKERSEIAEREAFLEDQIAVAFGEAGTLTAGGDPIATYRTVERKPYSVKASSYRQLRLK